MIRPHALTRARAFHDPNYPSTETLDADQTALIADLNRKVADGEIVMERVPCLCGADDFDRIAAYDRYRLAQPTVICRRCGLIQLHPRMTDDTLAWFYGSDYYRSLYNPDFLELTQARFEASLNPQRKVFLEEALDGRRVDSVLELGCAAGQNLFAFHEIGKRIRGYDLGPKALKFGCGLGLDLREGSLADIDGGPYDLVILSHVMEHFNDPVAAVRDLARHLAEDGVFYVEVPDTDEFCLGSLQNAHVYYFSESTLTHALSRAGLEAIAINRCKPHIGMLCQKTSTPELPPLGREYDRMAALIRRHDRRERIKEMLDRLGVLKIAKRALGRS